MSLRERTRPGLAIIGLGTKCTLPHYGALGTSSHDELAAPENWAAFLLLERESFYESPYNAVRMDAEEAIGLFVFAVVCSALVYAVAVVFL